jgi:protein TonB
LGTLTLSLLTVNACILFWPTPTMDFSGATFDTRGQEVIQVEEIQQTTQEKRKPPPPIPQPPVVMPDDVVLDDIELEIADVALDLNEAGNDDKNVEGANTGNQAVAARADRSPSPVRIATPEYPPEANRRNVRAEVVVEVLVDERGRVAGTRVVERYLLNKDGSQKEAVDLIGYGIEESVLGAAGRHTFRPAIQGGQRVKSYSTLTFRIGIDS